MHHKRTLNLTQPLHRSFKTPEITIIPPTQHDRSEKDSLRQTNVELMDRLRKIWQRYKEALPPLGAIDSQHSSDYHAVTSTNASDTEESTCGSHKHITSTHQVLPSKPCLANRRFFFSYSRLQDGNEHTAY